MKKYNMDFKIETRSSISSNGKPKYTVKGYAAVPDHPYAYKYFEDKGKKFSLKEMFTKKGIENLVRKAKSKNIFIDALHELSFSHNIKSMLKGIQNKSGVDISQEANSIMGQISHSDIPIAKLESIEVDDKGIFVETQLNPAYRDVDEKHKQYFDAVWNSLKDGYLNKFSIDFIPKTSESDVIEGDLVPKIDDVEIFGISYTQGAANDMCDITEVAVRSVIEVRNETEVNRMEQEIKKENEELKRKVEDMQKAEADRKLSEQQSKEAEEKKSVEQKLEESAKTIAQQKIEMEALKADMEKRMAEFGKPTEKSVAPSEDRFRQQPVSEGSNVVQEALKLTPEVNTPKSGQRIQKWGYYKNPATKPNTDGRIGMGDMIYLQGQTNAVSKYPSDTLRALGQNDDIVLTKK